MRADEEYSELIRRAVSGDKAAMAVLLFNHHTFLARHIESKMSKLVKLKFEVDDILQETLRDASRSIRQKTFLKEIRSEKHFRNWLKQIAVHRIIDKALKIQAKKIPPPHLAIKPDSDSQRSLLEELTGNIETPSHIVSMHEHSQALHAATSLLHDDQGQAFRLHCLEEKSLDEVARIMGRTRGAVRALIHRAKNNIRTILGATSLWFSKK